MRQLNEIMIHCTATQPEWMSSSSVQEKVAEVRRWHVDNNGWSDIGYHYLIDRDGSIAEGRPIERAGAHVRGRNKNSVGVALVGGFGGAETDKIGDHFTDAQEASLRALIGQIKAEYGNLDVFGHNQFAAKACPCFYVPEWFSGGAARKVAQIPAEAAQVVEDAGKPPATSTTNWTALVGILGSGWAAFQSADPTVQAAAILAIAVLAYIMRERLRKANLGKAAKAVLG